ncbi:hypothetical protein LJC63_10100 [Ruminococcaceae bacterium OttesenSCG-928-L11]|nr:hypothetical protein [Ruminococcaceae bacterium OttesenSCG-928-L11]
MNRLRQLLDGRNGFDQLTAAVLLAGLVFLLAAGISGVAPISFLYLLCVIYAVYRVMSKDINKRRSENWKFVGALQKIAAWWQLRVKMGKERKTHRYLKCPQCGTRLRVPRGKGKIQITCTKCRESFVRKV